MKTKIAYIIILAMIYSMQINFAQEKLSTTFNSEKYPAVSGSDHINLPCSVEAPYYLNPPNGTIDTPVRDMILGWVNGAGTIYVEVWFGIASNILKVYDGPVISSYPLSWLNFGTTYQWYIICKNDTCGIQSSLYSFSTIEFSNVAFMGLCEEFNNLNNWTIVGPMGMTNWTANPSSNAGGTPPELQFRWSPSFNGESKIRSYDLQLLNNFYTAVSFNFFFDWYDDPSGTITVGITYDGGSTSTILFSLTNPTGNVGPILFQDAFYAPGVISSYAQFEITYTGNSYNVNNIYWDNVCIAQCLSCTPPGAPSNLNAQVIYNPNPQIQLNWQDNSWNESGFRIFRKNGQPGDPGNYILVGTVGQNQIQYIDDTVLPESTYTYKVFAYNQYGQNSSNTTTIAVPVPVELISFTSEVDNNNVTLFWQTATETNNSGFEIERKKSEARSQESEWKRIEFVEGKGTTTETQVYSFIDKNLITGKYNYRLKQIDFDGTFEYSNVIEVEVTSPSTFSFEQNYPNPFNPSTKISYQLPVSSDVTLKVYDILGKEVVTLVDEYKPAGKYEVEFNALSSFRLVRNLTSGTYFYQLQAGSFIETKKMSLLK